MVVGTIYQKTKKDFRLAIQNEYAYKVKIMNYPLRYEFIHIVYDVGSEPKIYNYSLKEIGEKFDSIFKYWKEDSLITGCLITVMENDTDKI